MRRTFAVAVVLALVGCGARAPEPPYTGVWKLVLLHPGEETTLFLAELTDKGDGIAARLISPGQKMFAGVQVEAKRDGDTLDLFVAPPDGAAMRFTFVLPADGTTPAELLGCAERPGERQFVRLERGVEEKLDPKKTTNSHPAAHDFRQARGLKDVQARASAMRALADDHKADVLGYFARIDLLSVAVDDEATLRRDVDEAAAFAASHGLRMKARTLDAAARMLLANGKHAALAADCAAQAEETLGPAAPVEERILPAKSRAEALRRAGRTDDARAAAARVEALEQELDTVYEKNAVPFATPPLTRLGDKEDRVTLVELFTGAHCGPCVPADIAFSALLRSRRGGDVVLLQYHLHTAGTDALGNADADRRARYYEPPGTPWFYVDGKDGPEAGGEPSRGQEFYDALVQTTRAALAKPAGAKLTLSATRRGDAVEVQADVADVSRSAGQARLRLAIVEEAARYPGRNGIWLHHKVVRGFAGGAGGVTVAGGTARVALDLAELRAGLKTYLDSRGVADGQRPTTLKKLKVVGFHQDDLTKEVLQAAEIDLPD